MRPRWAELVAAFTLLTRLPVGGLAREHPPPGACVWAYPLVGLVVGGIGAMVLAGAMALGMAQPLAAVWALAATVLVTGGLHEDGLADTADGFGGGHTRERKLAIMRDSRIGTFGALALGFSLVLRVLALGVAERPGWAMVTAAVLGRGAMLVPLLMLRPARGDGLGASLHPERKEPSPAGGRGLGEGGSSEGAVSVTALTPTLSRKREREPARTGLPLRVGLMLTAAFAIVAPRPALAALVAALAVTVLARRQIGGYTGDVFGATEQAAECAALSV